MGTPLEKWQERAKATYNVHINFKAKVSTWTINQTADYLSRAYGSVNDDLMIIQWSRSHPQVLDFLTIKEAIEFIRKKKRELFSLAV